MMNSYEPFSGESFLEISSRLESGRSPSRFAGIQSVMIRELSRTLIKFESPSISKFRLEIKPDSRQRVGRSYVAKYTKKSGLIEVRVAVSQEEVQELGNDEHFDFLKSVLQEALGEAVAKALSVDSEFRSQEIEEAVNAAWLHLEQIRVVTDHQPIEHAVNQVRGFLSKLREELQEKHK